MIHPEFYYNFSDRMFATSFGNGEEKQKLETTVMHSELFAHCLLAILCNSSLLTYAITTKIRMAKWQESHDHICIVKLVIR